MRNRLTTVFGLLLALPHLFVFAQENHSPPASISLQTTTAAPSAANPAALTLGAIPADQIRDLIRKVAEKDIEDDKKQRDYTYTEHEAQRRLDGRGQVTSNESNTYEVMMLYGEQVRRRIAHNDRPLSEKENAKEEEKIQKVVIKRRDETEEQRKKRLDKEAKDHEEEREFVREVADAYNFRLVEVATLDGRETYLIDADPRPGFQPHHRDAKYLPKFRFRVWIDKAEAQWVKLYAEAIDTVSWGLFIARLHKGSLFEVAQTRVNEEVWLPKQVVVKLDAKIGLLKDYSMEVESTYRDYKKFRTDTKIVPLGKAEEAH
jgi:hypothetical protein